MKIIEQWLGVDFSQPVELIIAFILVMVLIVVVMLIVRGLFMRGGDGFRGKQQRRQRLFVGEWVRVDEKRRLQLVRCDDVEHLLLIGGNSDIVVQADVNGQKVTLAPAATSEPAVQPDVYTPPEEPRIPTTDPGYRSPLRPEPAVSAPVQVAAATTPVAAEVAADAPAEQPADVQPVAEASSEPATPAEAPAEEPKLTGLQAARARIAALRKKSAEMSAPVAPAAATTARH